MSSGRAFKYSGWDVLNVAVIPVHVAFFVWLAFAFHGLSLAVLIALLPVLFAISLQNGGANHNHYHTPFFRQRWLNTLTRMGYSMTAMPKTPYNIGHGVHHATNRSWNEASIVEILGLDRPLHVQVLAFGQYVLESLGLRYLVLLYLLKHWPAERIAAFAAPKELEIATAIFQKLKLPYNLREAKLDLAAWMAFRILLCAIDWRFFLFYFVPTTYAIETIRMAENFLQHWGASDPDDSTRDSVSSYGIVYNLLTFNLGFHQEHHYRPGVHWRKLPELRAALPTDRRTVPVCHYLNLPLVYPRFAKSLAARLRNDPAA